MTHAVREWLPRDALTQAALVARLDAAVAAWSTRWFAGRGPKRVGRGQASTAPAGNWVRLGTGIWVEGGVSLTLAWRALGYDGVQPKAVSADERVLVAYAARIARDLAAALGETLGTEEDADATAPPAGVIVRLGDRSPARSMQVLISESVLVAPRKALCPAWSRPPGEAVALSDVLAPVRIAFEASLGSARANALELRDIAPGDTIVLQRATEDPVLLRALDTGAVIGGAKLAFGEDGYQLKAS